MFEKDLATMANLLGIPFFIIPIFSGCVWLAMILAMLLWWTVEKHSQYLAPMDDGQHIAFVPLHFNFSMSFTKLFYRYISDVGAHQLQPLFIAMGAVTVVTFDVVFISERWLRHRRWLAPNTSWFQKMLSLLAIFFAIVGAIGLIILTCLNDWHHSKAHDSGLAIFM